MQCNWYYFTIMLYSQNFIILEDIILEIDLFPVIIFYGANTCKNNLLELTNHERAAVVTSTFIWFDVAVVVMCIKSVVEMYYRATYIFYVRMWQISRQTPTLLGAYVVHKILDMTLMLFKWLLGSIIILEWKTTIQEDINSNKRC